MFVYLLVSRDPASSLDSSFMDSQARESEPTEWTDEKHSLFLKSMESTFVNQLYKSIDLFSLHTRNSGPSESRTSTYKKTGNRAVSGQVRFDIYVIPFNLNAILSVKNTIFLSRTYVV